MKFTIVADDGAVGVDGKFFSNVDLSQLDPTIHAVQWHEEYGEVEYKTKFENGVFVKPQNVIIDNIAAYQFAIDGWNIANAQAVVAEKEIADAIAAAKDAAANQPDEQPEPVQNDEV